MRRTLLLVLLAAAVAVPGARAADTLIAELPQPVQLSARGELLAYSRLDEDGRWRLVLWEKGVGRDAPIASRREPFDVDLGYVSGGTQAAYSRCEGRATCDLFTFDVQTGDERRIPKVSRSGADETRPAIHGDTVVFARGAQLWSTAGRVSRTLPNGWDLRGPRLLTTTGGFRPNLDRSDVYLNYGPLGGPGRELHHASSGLLSSVEFPRPTLGGRDAFVAQVRWGAAGQRFVRVNVRTRKRTQATGRGSVLAAVPLGDRVAYLTGFGWDAHACSHPEEVATPCRLLVTPALTYR